MQIMSLIKQTYHLVGYPYDLELDDYVELWSR